MFEGLLRGSLVATPVINLQGPILDRPIPVDMVILRPATPLSVPMPFLQLAQTPPEIGSEVIFGGFADETAVPFEIDRVVNQRSVGLDTLRAAIPLGIRHVLAGPMLKRGAIGNVTLCRAGTDQAMLDLYLFYIDNSAHEGASGGPIVDLSGQVQGIIIKRATTLVTAEREQNELTVPSGSTLGLSTHFLRRFDAVPQDQKSSPG